MRHTAIAWTVLIAIIVIGAIYVLATMSWRTASAPGNTTATSTGSAVTFYCQGGKTMQANFASSSVVLSLSDGRTAMLPQQRMGSGIRYEATTTFGTTTEDVAFISQGDSAFLTENGTQTYQQCTAAQVAPSATAGYKTYTDHGKTFSFVYPDAFMVTGVPMGYGTSWAQDATTSGMELARIDVPQSYEPGTNFGNAWFSVGVSANPSAVATCLQNTSGMPPATTTQTTIHGVSFTKMEYVGAGAGNRYDTTSFRTVRNNMCYAVEYTIHYGVLQNYPKGAVQAYNKQKVASALNGIVQSFHFLGS